MRTLKESQYCARGPYSANLNEKKNVFTKNFGIDFCSVYFINI